MSSLPDETENQPGTYAPGTVLGAYVIERPIGEGGMAVVYEARHRGLDKRVAIKMLLPHHATRKDVAKRFLREGEAAARLRHPHVVDVTDVGVDAAGNPYLVMEFLHGESLAGRLERAGKLSVRETTDLLVPVVSAIAAAHDAGIVHRDLKPDNIFLCTERREIVPKVLDFGISKRMDGESMLLTGTDALLGTPYYMSPEQAQGARNVDGRTDQFALGVILYECVTGQRPFQGESLYTVLSAIIHSQQQPPSKIVYPLEPRFEALVDRLLKKAPAARFANVRELGRELLALASPRTKMAFGSELGSSATAPDDFGEAPPPPTTSLEGTGEPIVRSASRLPWLAAGVLAAVGLVATVLVASRESAPTPKTALQPPAPPHVASPATAPAPVPAKRFSISVSVQPAQARLAVDGRAVGIGSYSGAFPLDGVTHTLEAGAPGHETVKLHFVDEAPPAHIELKKLHSGQRSERAPGKLSRTPPAPPPEKSTAEVPAPNAEPTGPRYGANRAPILH